MIDNIRKQKRMSYQDQMEDQAKVPEIENLNLKEVLDLALAKLPEIQRSAILLRDYEGYSYDEIGEMLNLSASQVKVYIFRARTTLKNYLISIENIL